MKCCCIILFTFLNLISFAQLQDSIQVKDTLIVLSKKATYSKARRAAIFSACLPGLGQAYNKKYWKIPIIYAGIGGFGYLFYSNSTNYKYYRKNLLALTDTDSNTNNETVYSQDQLQILKLQYKRYRDIGAIGMGIIYLINIIDANVDGHLQTFDVSDDLSLHIDPWQNKYQIGNSNYKTVYGLSLKLTFK